MDFRYDLQNGLDMLHQSAHLGNTLAQQLLVDLYPASDTAAIEPSFREIWLKDVIETGLPRPAYALPRSRSSNSPPSRPPLFAFRVTKFTAAGVFAAAVTISQSSSQVLPPSSSGLSPSSTSNHDRSSEVVVTNRV
jgi:hypothetical protein